MAQNGGQFQRAFVLAEGIDVTGAFLDKGMLHIDLARPPTESLVRSVEIKSATKKGRQPLDIGLNDG